MSAAVCDEVDGVGSTRVVRWCEGDGWVVRVSVVLSIVPHVFLSDGSMQVLGTISGLSGLFVIFVGVSL